MSCVVHFLPAKAGDCFVVELDNKDCIVIDCGYKTTYELELKPLLIRLCEKGCRVVLLIVTHIDQDHIEGAIQLITENGPYDNPQIIPIENIWFNGFFNTLFSRKSFENRRTDTLDASIKRKRSEVLKDLRMQCTGVEGCISAKQSKSFEQLCAQNNYKLNLQFEDRVVQQKGQNRDEKGINPILIGECTVSVLGPKGKALDALAQELDKEMVRMFGVNYKVSEDEEFGNLFELLMELQSEEVLISQAISAQEESLEGMLGTSTLAPMSTINRASIVVEIEYKGICMLFTGDSDSADWAKLLAPHYDLIKLSHHGTTKPNLSLLEKTQGEALLISTDGGRKDRHPEKELLARAILRGNKNLYFNYEICHAKMMQSMQEEYGFTMRFCEREIRL